ncbi:MAG: cysteine synthase A [Planctomycetes bacterium]|nr:cysteine synthase A [Planctomycetota bacterium]
MALFESNTAAIGATPLVQLNVLNKGAKAKVLVKIEARNPAFSVKCRIASNMVAEAEKDGSLKAGMTVVEPTSGNTGIGLAYVCAAKGYKCILTMPDTMSMERRNMMAVYGAELVLTPGAEGVGATIRKAEEIAASNDDYYMPQQFKNPANPAIHEKTTGPEIWEDTNGEIDILVSGVGTGGTISGVSRFIKQEKGKAITSIAVEPVASPVIKQKLAGEDLVPGKHKIQGIGAGFIPDTLDLSIVDGTEQVSDEDAFEAARDMALKEGIVCGISSGAAVVAALRLANKEENAGKTIVAILPDSGERYLSTVLFDGIL